MNKKQSNLYACLDMLQVNAYVGKGVFDITNGIKIRNDCFKGILKAKGIAVIETENSTYAILRIGGIGLVLTAKNSKMINIRVLDFTHRDTIEYLDSKDYKALLLHLSVSDSDIPWLLETISL